MPCKTNKSSNAMSRTCSVFSSRLDTSTGTKTSCGSSILTKMMKMRRATKIHLPSMISHNRVHHGKRTINKNQRAIVKNNWIQDSHLTLIFLVTMTRTNKDKRVSSCTGGFIPWLVTISVITIIILLSKKIIISAACDYWDLHHNRSRDSYYMMLQKIMWIFLNKWFNT